MAGAVNPVNYCRVCVVFDVPQSKRCALLAILLTSSLAKPVSAFSCPQKVMGSNRATHRESH